MENSGEENKNSIYQEGQVLLLDKPYEWTSFDLVNKVRWLLRRKLNVKKIKVGHAGTLDPLATGLMIICTGKATKQIDSYQAQEKEYIASIKLGSTTPSFDIETEVDQEYPYEHITEELVQTALQQFIGEIDQIPPMFSAKKVKGKKLYELAREGKTIELKPSRIRIDKIEILEFDLPVLKLKINCSKGTYIRSLARDTGKALNSGGHLLALKRTAIGQFHLENAETIDNFAKKLQDL